MGRNACEETGIREMNYLLLWQWNEALSNELLALVPRERVFKSAMTGSRFTRTEPAKSSQDLLAPVAIEPNGSDSTHELLAPLSFEIETIASM